MNPLIAILFTVTQASPPAALPARSIPTQPSDFFCRADRDAIERIAVAEAATEGDSGLAAVVLVVRNRLLSGLWGLSIDAVLNAPGQFEPVTKRGQWRLLPAPSREQHNHIAAILNLICDGHLPDFTFGALYFQNREIVEARSWRGEVSSDLIAFGGATPTAVVGRHSFYRKTRFVGDGPKRSRQDSRQPAQLPLAIGAIFYGSEARATEKTAVDIEQSVRRGEP
jgi:spore germination cell wall hydrolase CwlJ-like protein